MINFIIKIFSNLEYENIIQPFFDLFKYYITLNINTGDKSFDSYLISFIIVLFSLFVNKKYISKIFNFKDFDIYDDYYIENYQNLVTVVYSSEDITQNDFDSNVENYLASCVKLNYMKSNTFEWYHSKNNKANNGGSKLFSNGYKYKKKFNKNGELMEIPVYIYTTKNGKYVYSCYNKFISNDIESIYEFKNFINEKYKDIVNKKNENNEKVKNYVFELLDIGEESERTKVFSKIYSDRTFDKWISIHKEKILKLIDRYDEAKKTNSSHLNGFGTYNLGIILNGEPGTGKTSFVKAIANKLNMNVLIVNSKNLKTINDFNSFVSNYEEYILFLDEFDSIPGVLKNDSNINYKTEIDELKKNRLNLLNNNSNNDKNIELVKNEILKLDKEIKNIENRLDVFNILTILDGMKEQRGRILIACTNNIDDINPTLLREGRFDFKFKLTKYVSSEIKELCCKMFPEKENIIKKIQFEDNKFVPVQLINLALQNNFNDFIDIIKKK